jgi:tetraacyldisaccharide 4'-kinase
VASNWEQEFLAIVSGRKRGLGAALLRFGLRTGSWPYAAAVVARNWLFDHGWKRSYDVKVPVVSIGNLTLGGTGKTPAVEYIARFYRRQERRVAILSRGYGSESGRNDEALVLEDNLPDVPHLQGADRVALAETAALELESEVLLLDDGFQHRRLKRDLDIVLIDATNPWGHGWVFPGGLLREPRSGLRRAQLALLTRCDQAPPETVADLQADVQRLAPGIPVVQSRHAPDRLVNAGQQQASFDILAGKPVAAFCGIGNPAAFQKTLEELHCNIAAFEIFPDHHRYTREDVDRLREWARQLPENGLVVTTQKDLVKIQLETLGGRPLWAAAIALLPTAGQEALDAKLNGVLA